MNLSTYVNHLLSDNSCSFSGYLVICCRTIVLESKSDHTNTVFGENNLRCYLMGSLAFDKLNDF